MLPGRFDFTISKKARFYQEINLTDLTNTPVSLVGKTIKCIIKESHNTSTILHTLVEGDGIEVLDDATGKFAMFIAAEDTDVSADFGVYDVLKVDETYWDGMHADVKRIA